MQKLHEPDTTLVEVIDTQGYPLMLMPFGSVLRQQLLHKVAVTAVFLGNKLLLCQTACVYQTKNPTWDLPFTNVQQGESFEDACLRVVQKTFGTVPEKFQTYELSDEPFSYTRTKLLAGRMPAQICLAGLHTAQEILLVDQEELKGLSADLPDMFGPFVLWALAHAALFGKKS